MKRFDKVDMNKFTQLLHEALNNKEIRCNDCGKLAKFVSYEELINGKEKIPYVNGATMFCGECDYEDDISQGNVRFKSGNSYNLYDYFEEVGLNTTIESWDDALEILETIDKELEDRKRVAIKKDGEVTLEEQRATELKEVFSRFFPTKAEEKEEGRWEVRGGSYMKGKEGNAVGFEISFMPNENRVFLAFFVHNIEVKKTTKDTIDAFEKVMLAEKSIRKIYDKYDCNFGASDDGEGAFVVQYTFDKYSFEFIIDTFFSIFKAAAENIYKIKDKDEVNDTDEESESIITTNAQTYQFMRRLAEFLDGYNDAINDIYFEEDDYYYNEEYVDKIEERKLNMYTHLGISNFKTLDNEISIRIDGDYFSEHDEDSTILTIHPMKDESGKLMYSMVIEDDNYNVTEIGEAYDIYSALIGILNARHDYLKNIRIDNDTIFELREETPEFLYAENKVSEQRSYNSIIMLASALECWNKKNEKIKYEAHETFGHGYSNGFTVLTDDLNIRGQADFRNPYIYRVTNEMDDFLEDQTLEQTIEFILSEMEIDADIDPYIEESKNNTILELMMDSQIKKVDFDEAMEAIRVFNLLEKLHFTKTYPKPCDTCKCFDCEEKDECEDNECDYCDEDSYVEEDYFKEDSELYICPDKHMEMGNPYISLKFEHEDSTFTINIDKLKKNDMSYIYNLTIIQKGISFKNFTVEGIENLISFITNIKLYGDNALNSSEKFNWNEDIELDKLMKSYTVPTGNIKIFNLLEYLKNNYKEINVSLIFRDHMGGGCLPYVLARYNNNSFEVRAFNNGKYTVTLAEYPSRYTDKVYNNLKTKRQVADVILGRNLTGKPKEVKLKETNILCNMYYNEISSNIDTLDYLLNNYENKESVNAIKEVKERLNYLCKELFKHIYWIDSYAERAYSHRVDTSLSDIENLRQEVSNLKEEKELLKTQSDTIKHINNKEDMKEFSKFISQVNWATQYFRI